MVDPPTPAPPGAAPGAGWPDAIRADLAANAGNPRVGTRLLSADESARVWEVRLGPGARIGFHRHVLDYVWVAATPGAFVSRQADGTVVAMSVEAGRTSHSTYGPGEFEVHNLENVGTTELVFTTVEFVRSANPPPPLPDGAEAEMSRAVDRASGGPRATR